MKKWTKKQSVIWGLVLVVLAACTMLPAAAGLRNLAITLSTINSTTLGATTPAAGTFTALGANTGVDASKTGFKHFRGTSCTTAAVASASCNTTVTWPGSAFADTNYTAGCSLNDVTTPGAAWDFGTGTKTTTTMVTGIQNIPGSSLAVSGQLNCWAIHDAP